MIMQTMAIIMKKPAQDMAVATERKVDDMMVAVTRFINVATLMAFARIIVLNTSEGMSQAPGPIPILKNARYNPNPTIAPTSLATAPMKLIATMKNETDMPTREMKTKGLRPVLSSKRPAKKITPNLINPKPTKIHICVILELIPLCFNINTKKYMIASIPTACCAIDIPMPTIRILLNAGLGNRMTPHPTACSAILSFSIDSLISVTITSTSYPSG
mmetsp:Transcript_25359/g.41174  ORF Transcript_25359/g.41174 Transcript_25359/m.41174 type:complete len:217 (-) Transcript_25359:901-1551(-)